MGALILGSLPLLIERQIIQRSSLHNCAIYLTLSFQQPSPTTGLRFHTLILFEAPSLFENLTIIAVYLHLHSLAFIALNDPYFDLLFIALPSRQEYHLLVILQQPCILQRISMQPTES